MRSPRKMLAHTCLSAFAGTSSVALNFLAAALGALPSACRFCAAVAAGAATSCEQSWICQRCGAKEQSLPKQHRSSGVRLGSAGIPQLFEVQKADAARSWAGQPASPAALRPSHQLQWPAQTRLLPSQPASRPSLPWQPLERPAGALAALQTRWSESGIVIDTACCTWSRFQTVSQLQAVSSEALHCLAAGQGSEALC